MMKKLTAMLLVLSMLLMTAAFAWSCPSCGSDNGGKFCTECGAKKPEDVICPSCGTNYGDAAPKFCTECGTKLGEAAATAAPTATPAPTAAPAEALDVVVYQHDDGRIFLLWDADGTTEYIVHYFPMLTDDPKADVADASNVCFGRFDTDSLGVYPCSYMVPGEAYWVGVFDAEGNGEYMPYIPQEEVTSFTDCPVTVQTTEVLRQDGEDTQVESFVAADLTGCAADTRGLYLVLIYNNAGAEAEHVLQVVMELPDGQRYVSHVVKATFQEATDDGIGWRFYDLVDDVEKITQALGEVPVGEYKVSLYLNGQLAGMAPFQVVEEAASTALEINGFVPLGDGSAEVSWMGGTGPYDVYYCIRMSESIEDDCEYAAEYGFLQTAKTGLQATETILYELIPGEKYWIIVCDAQGEQAHTAVKTQTEAFTDFTTELVLSSNPVDANKDNLATDFSKGVYMGFVYDNPGEAQQALLLCVVDYGNGHKKVTEAGRFVMQSGKNCLDMGNFASMDALMEHLASNESFEIEQDVTLSIFLNGKLAGQAVVPAEQDDTLHITDRYSNGNGTVTLNWAGGTAPYRVCYHVKRSEDYQADRSNPNGTGRWMAVDGLTDTSYTLTELVPGVSYWLTVFDAEDAGWYVAYDAPEAPQSVPGVESYLEVVPKARVGENVTEIDLFPVDAIGVEDDTEYGASIKLHYTNTGEERKALFQLVYTLPGGAVLSNYEDEVTLHSGSHWVGWGEFRSVESLLSYLRGLMGGINEGDLKVEVYLDGCLAGSAVIPVGQPAPQRNSGVEITGIVENADGTATVTWTDEFGRAPYEIDYVQKFTDDYEADFNTGTGYWYDTKEAAGGSHTLYYLTPGQAYWVAVYDANGYGQYIAYVPSAAQAFSEFPLKLRIQPKLRTDGKDVNVSQFSSAEIGANLAEHGVYLMIDYPQLARARQYLGVVSITSPDGSRVVNSSFDLPLSSGAESSIGWDYFDLDWYFGILQNNMGACPVGTYTVELFCDGELAATTTFSMTN